MSSVEKKDLYLDSKVKFNNSFKFYTEFEMKIKKKSKDEKLGLYA